MTAITEPARPPFAVLIMSDQDRLGRDMLRTATAIRDIVESGIRVYTYLDGAEITSESLMDQVKVIMAGFGGQFERERGAARVKDTLRGKVARGEHGGGRIFGYRVVPVVGPGGQRTHSVLEIDPEQAAVVTRIFEGIAAGVSMERLACTLTDDNAPAPERATGRGWRAGAIRHMIRNELYKGIRVWARRENIRRRGTAVVRLRDPGEVLRVEMPHLAIVAARLWQAAQEALAKKEAGIQRGPRGHLQGRLEGAVTGAFLLSNGLAVCQCEAGMRAHRRSHHRDSPHFYRCGSNYIHGPRVCANDLAIPMVEADNLVITSLSDEVLTPQRVARWIEAAIDTWQASAGSVGDRRAALEAEIVAVEREIAKLEDDLATGAPWALIQTPIEARKAKREDLHRRLQREDEMTALHSRGTALRQDLAARVAGWREVLRRHPVQARGVLKRLLEGPLTFAPFTEPPAAGYHIGGYASFGRLLSGIVTIGAVSGQAPGGMGGPFGAPHP